jgi:D-glycero-D-manno-heptose 1,7-bisphosphate phosphatase
MTGMKTVLVDRDGTIIVDPPDERVDKIEKIELFPDTIEALRYLAEHDFAIVFVTNQAGIAEGRINEAEFEIIHDKVKELLAPSSVTILRTYMCPHGPAVNCDCRKPKPKLVLQAVHDFSLDPKTTYFVGDRESDIMAGVNAGTKTVLVKTANVPVESEEADYTAPTLLDAMKYVVAHS